MGVAEAAAAPEVRQVPVQVGRVIGRGRPEDSALTVSRAIGAKEKDGA